MSQQDFHVLGLGAHDEKVYTTWDIPLTAADSFRLSSLDAMSNAMFANKWLEDGNGPGSPMRPGCGRYGARNALIKHHNVRRGRLLRLTPLAVRARAQSDAARTRLDRAVREAEDAEHAELDGVNVAGHREALDGGVYAEQARGDRAAGGTAGRPPRKVGGAYGEGGAAEANAPPPPSKTPQRSRNAGAAPAKEATASPSSDARKAGSPKCRARRARPSRRRRAR